MAEITITIVGTGSIGASLGLALKNSRIGKDLVVIGHDKEHATAGQAKSLGAVDRTEWNLINACEPADLIFLAIPPQGIRPTLEAIAPYLKEDCVITDTSRMKSDVMRWAGETLPDTVHFVGGDPVVITAGHGPAAAREELFRGALYCLTPSPDAREDAVKLVTNAVSLMGGQPYFLDAAEHDSLVTAVDLLPDLLSISLMHATSRKVTWREMRKLAGGAFGNETALSMEDPDAIGENCMGRRDDLVRWIDEYIDALRHIRSLLETGEPEPFIQLVDGAIVERRRWLEERKLGHWDAPGGEARSYEPPTMMERMFGSLARKRTPSDKKK